MRPALAPVIFSGQQFSPASIPDLGLWLDPSAPGSVLTDAACQFAAASSQYLRPTGTPFNDTFVHWAGWVKLTTTAADQTILSWGKTDASVALSMSYRLYYKASNGTITWEVSRNSAAFVTLDTGFLEILAGEWHFLAVYSNNDPGNEEIGFSIDGSTYSVTVGPTGGTPVIGSTFQFGATPEADDFLNGVLDEWFYTSRSLTGPELTALFNLGAGRQFDYFSGSLLSATTNYFRLRENTGNRVDSVGSVALVPTNSPTSTTGISSSYASDGDPVYQINDVSGNARHFTQATSAAKPAYRTSVTNGQPILRFDGSDDLLSGNAAALAILNDASGATVFLVNKAAAVVPTSRTYFIGRNVSASPRMSGYKSGTTGTGNQKRRLDADTAITGGYALSYVDSAFYVETQLATHGAAAVGTVNIFMNGTSIGSNDVSAQGAGNFSATNSTEVSLGATVAGTAHLGMDLGELLIYRRTLTATERVAVERYLGRKWGVIVA